MAPVNIKYIVSFSSQDDHHKANNLIDSNGSKCWLSDPKDRSGKLEVILQLEAPCNFAYIDVGTVWCASLEIRVGCSDWPQSTEYKSLLPSINLMSPLDCLLDRATSSTKMFSKADFSKEIASQKWDRLQLICRQPFRKGVQLGVSFIRIRNMELADMRLNDTVNSLKQEKEDKKTQDVSTIKKHFFGSTDIEDVESIDPKETLKQRLMKISGSSENGCDHEHALSRTAKLVLKASESSPKQRTASAQPKRGLFSEHLAKKHGLPFETEVNNFLSAVKISPQDLDTVTIAELRHKFEKRKHRKLTAEEKKTFLDLCQNFICDMFEPKQNGSIDLGQSEVESRLGNGGDPIHRQQKNCSTQKSADALSPAASREQLYQAHHYENKVDGPYKTPPNKRLFYYDRAGSLTPGSKKKRRSGEEVNFDLDMSGLMGEDELEKRCDLESIDCELKHYGDQEDPIIAKYTNNSKVIANNSTSELIPHTSAVSTCGTILNSGSKKLKKIYQNKHSSGILSDSSVGLQESPLTEAARDSKSMSKRMQHKATDRTKYKCSANSVDAPAIAASSHTKAANVSKQSREKKKGRKLKEKKRKSNSNDTDISLCDKCYAMVPKEDKGIHYLFCIPASPQPEPRGTVCHELLLDDTVDYAECPICLERFPCDVLPVHASECGL